MEIIGKKKYYFAFSFLLIIPGIVFLSLGGLKLSIDFTGGSRLEYQVSESSGRQISNEEIASVFKKQNVQVSSIQKKGKDVYLIRTKPIDQKRYEAVTKTMTEKYKQAKPVSFQTIGPTIGSEITANALKAVVIASFLIVLYIAWSFRKVPKPASGLRFGVCAIIALLHDVLVLVGFSAILGYFFGVEIDTLFITALLTVIGFSVHDTIVVFDRIRENLRRLGSLPFPAVVNESILQTFGRSINTSVTVLLVLVSLLLFGGESIRWFVVALLVGIASGTYSSIFNAAPLLVVWEEWLRKKKNY